MIRITQAAVKLKDGRVFTGMRHGYIVQNALLAGMQKEEFYGSTQGFIDNKNKFYTRKEAMELVMQNGQLPNEIIGGCLTSEDLW